MRKIFLYITSVIITLLFAGCQADEKSYQDDLLTEDEGVFTLTAIMPDEEQNKEAKTRVALTRDGSGISLTWENNDEIRLLFVQDGTKATRTVIVNDISENGKSASFQFTLPTEIDSNGDFDLYGVYGGEGFNSNYELVIPESTSNGSLNAVQENEDMILYFSAKDIQADNPGNIDVDFEHLGALFSITLLNKSGNQLDLSGGVTLVSGTSGWSHISGSYDLVTGTFSSGGTSNSISFNAPVANLAANKSITLYKWLPVLPTGNINSDWPDLNLEINGITSTDNKPGRTATPGKNYLLYAQHSGDQVSFRDPIYIFQDNFNRGNTDWVDVGQSPNPIGTDWWITMGQFQIIDQQLKVQPVDSHVSIFYEAEGAITKNVNGSFELSADLIAVSPVRWVGLILNAQDENNYYVFRMHDTNGIQFLSTNNGGRAGGWTVFLNITTGYNLSQGTYHIVIGSEQPGIFDINVTKEGGEVYFSQEIDITAAPTLLSNGLAGFFMTGSGQSNLFDNFSLEVR